MLLWKTRSVRRRWWDDDDDDREDRRDNLVNEVEDRGSLSTLFSLLRASGLDKTLRKRGPFTLLAPNNDAFEKLPEGTIEALLKDQGQLRDVLKLHVFERRVTAKQASDSNSVKTLQGKRLDIEDSDDGLKFNSAKVVRSNIRCDNGIIHIIDTVLTDD